MRHQTTSSRIVHVIAACFVLTSLILCQTTTSAYTTTTTTTKCGAGGVGVGVGSVRATSLKCSISSEEVRLRLVKQLEKLRERDRNSKVLKSEELDIVYQDEFLVVVDKPCGVLSVPSEQGVPSLTETVFETVDNIAFSSYDRMVCHRIGMDTSGLIVFAKTLESLRGMNTLFRTRQVTRKYEVLVCGHVDKDKGTIDMPLMRDYLHPPFMRISTEQRQRELLNLDPAVVGKKILEAPKPSRTKYEVVSRETLLDTGLPVTRLTLTSITGRTHQLNVHCAAFGHPIVGDQVYGLGGEAAPNGGLEGIEHIFENAASTELQKDIAEAARGMNMCVHAKYVAFKHPITSKHLIFESKTPF